MKTGIIYKVTNTINGKSYIGLSILPLNIRKSIHISDAFTGKKDNLIFHIALRKYGLDNFQWKVIQKGIETILSKLEQFYIKFYNSYYKENGYNMTLGGECGNGISGRDHYMFDNKLYNFYHFTGIEEKNITFYDMRFKYNIPHHLLRRLINGKFKFAKGWTLNKELFFDKKFSNCKDKLFSFSHINGNKEINVTRTYMTHKYNLHRSHLSGVCSGKYKSVKGWTLLI